MVDNIVSKPLGLVLIITAHMVFNGPTKAEDTEVTGTLGSNITLTFKFKSKTVIHNKSEFAVYMNKNSEKKIADWKCCTGSSTLEVSPEKNSVLYHITNLKQNDSEMYWATLFVNSTIITSEKVRLGVREENRSITVPPMSTNITVIEDSGSSTFLYFQIVTVLVVSAVVLLAAILPCLIWCLVRTKDKQPSQQQSSNPTLQETLESSSVPPPSVIYSVLDFPKRSSAVMEINPNDTEYAAVSYLPEKRIV